MTDTSHVSNDNILKISASVIMKQKLNLLDLYINGTSHIYIFIPVLVHESEIGFTCHFQCVSS